MGYLLKEALKTLCGVNQWSYAVFWKIGNQNPKLLIWEDCYYEAASCSVPPGNETPGNAFQDCASCILTETRNAQPCIQAGENVQFLVNKMMMDNHVNIVGEGLVGRVAFTGNHRWIVSENIFTEAHLPEVLKKVSQQFSAGIRTLAVIPVLPYGVVQFGSCNTIMENIGFVNEVISLMLQLGRVPGIWPSENYATKEVAPIIGFPVCQRKSALESNVISASSLFNTFNYVKGSSQNSVFDGQTSYSLHKEKQNDLQSNFAAFPSSNSSSFTRKPYDFQHEAKIDSAVNSDFSTSNQLINELPKSELILPNTESWNYQHASKFNQRSSPDFSSTLASPMSRGTIASRPQIMKDTDNQGHFSNANMSPAILLSATNSGLIRSPNGSSVTLSSAEVNEQCKNSISSNMRPVSAVDSVSDAKRVTCENNTSKHSTSSEFHDMTSLKMEDSDSDTVNLFSVDPLLAYDFGSKIHRMDNKFMQSELSSSSELIEQHTIIAHDTPPYQQDEHLNMTAPAPSLVENEIRPLDNIKLDDLCAQPQSGDDLFDVVGADFKNKLFSSSWNSCLSNEPAADSRENNSFLSRKSPNASELYSTSQGTLKPDIFCSTGDNHLLDAVVSKVHHSANQSFNDNVSCRTTLTDMSYSSAPNSSHCHSQFGVSNNMKGELTGVSRYPAKPGTTSFCSLKTSKEDSVCYSQGSSVHGSQVTSCIGKGKNTKQNNSVSTGYSKKPDETGKPNRKRLKSGENPKPRPKDRQMIQDRLKELREIVPNGSKCAIDALLERTIKHMIFLQSVTKHADKLKQTGESKIISKNGSLLLRDEFEGGATWAYEVGSQSMVCPIVVEDLNQPHQILVEMVFEESDMFLEIADTIRGLGLTILKGVMETRNNKMWARFVVEANRDITRMEIFMSLLHLLEQNNKTDASQLNDMSSEHSVVQQLQGASSLPMTGRSCSLW